MGKIAGGAVLCVMLAMGMVSADTAPPAAKGKTLKVRVKKAVTLGGVRISFGSASHKHAVGGDTLGMWSFVAKKGKATTEIELRSDERYFEAEVTLHGAAFVFRHVDYETFDVTLFAAKAPAPLDEETCLDRLDDLARKQKYKPHSSRSATLHQGIVAVTTDQWIGMCGTLTRRLWVGSLPPATTE